MKCENGVVNDGDFYEYEYWNDLFEISDFEWPYSNASFELIEILKSIVTNADIMRLNGPSYIATLSDKLLNLIYEDRYEREKRDILDNPKPEERDNNSIAHKTGAYSQRYIAAFQVVISKTTHDSESGSSSDVSEELTESHSIESHTSSKDSNVKDLNSSDSSSTEEVFEDLNSSEPSSTEDVFEDLKSGGPSSTEDVFENLNYSEPKSPKCAFEPAETDLERIVNDKKEKEREKKREKKRKQKLRKKEKNQNNLPHLKLNHPDHIDADGRDDGGINSSSGDETSRHGDHKNNQNKDDLSDDSHGTNIEEANSDSNSENDSAKVDVTSSHNDQNKDDLNDNSHLPLLKLNHPDDSDSDGGDYSDNNSSSGDNTSRRGDHENNQNNDQNKDQNKDDLSDENIEEADPDSKSYNNAGSIDNASSHGDHKNNQNNDDLGDDSHEKDIEISDSVSDSDSDVSFNMNNGNRFNILLQEGEESLNETSSDEDIRIIDTPKEDSLKGRSPEADIPTNKFSNNKPLNYNPPNKKASKNNNDNFPNKKPANKNLPNNEASKDEILNNKPLNNKSSNNKASNNKSPNNKNSNKKASINQNNKATDFKNSNNKKSSKNTPNEKTLNNKALKETILQNNTFEDDTLDKIPEDGILKDKNIEVKETKQEDFVFEGDTLTRNSDVECLRENNIEGKESTQENFNFEGDTLTGDITKQNPLEEVYDDFNLNDDVFDGATFIIKSIEALLDEAPSDEDQLDDYINDNFNYKLSLEEMSKDESMIEYLKNFNEKSKEYEEFLFNMCIQEDIYPIFKINDEPNFDDLNELKDQLIDIANNDLKKIGKLYHHMNTFDKINFCSTPTFEKMNKVPLNMDISRLDLILTQVFRDGVDFEYVLYIFENNEFEYNTQALYSCDG